MLNPEKKSDISDRISRLEQSLSKSPMGERPAAYGKNGKDNKKPLKNNGYGYGASMAIEMFSALVVGFILGYGMDRIFDTTPWLTIGFAFLGILTGIVNILRIVQKENRD